MNTKNTSYALLGLLFTFVTPFIASAQIAKDGTAGADLGKFYTGLTGFLNVIVPFILGIAFLFFVWGVFQYFIVGGHSDEAQETGKTYIFSALIGFVIILSFWGLVNLAVSGLGTEKGNDKITAPSALPK